MLRVSIFSHRDILDTFGIEVFSLDGVTGLSGLPLGATAGVFDLRTGATAMPIDPA